ncbi:MAG: hypothetical protein HUJ58_01970, partial [Erysipelotrichaceae bacterium]|nr:hypothetical protein [Erysipelotrichaceae bacterium]
MKKRLLKVVLNLMLIVSLLPSAGIRVFAVNAEDTMSWLKFNEAHDTITGFNYQAGLSPEEITIPAK